MIGKINSFETLGLKDGPGVRVVIFLQGCPLRCIFCHNPETWNDTSDTTLTPQQTIEFIKRYKNYFGEDGGVTFSGGEPLMQPDYLLETLKICKKENINTCLDTSGLFIQDPSEILKYVDLVILDIKALDNDNYKNLTKQNINRFIEFLNICQRLNKKLWLRQVIIPGINDNIEYIYKLKDFIKKIKNVENIQLLPYHTMAKEKYKNLNIPYPLENIKAMDVIRCKELEEILKSN